MGKPGKYVRLYAAAPFCGCRDAITAPHLEYHPLTWHV